MESEPFPDRNRTRGNRAALISFVLAVGVSIALLALPTSTTETACVPVVAGQVEGASSLPVESCHSGVTRRSLLQDQGWGVVVPLSVPILISGIAWSLARTGFRRVAFISAAFLLFGFFVLTGFSIGLFYLPSAIAMFVAALAEGKVAVAT
jgi:hypothetical protein